MDVLGTAEAVMLRSQEGSYMSAHNNKKTVRQDKDGSSPNAKWVVETVEGRPNMIRLKSCFGQYLTAIDRKVNWVLMLYRVCGKLKSWGHKLLQVNGEPDSSSIFSFMRWVGQPRPESQAPNSQNWNWNLNWIADSMIWVGNLLQFFIKLARPDSIKHDEHSTQDGTSWHVEEAPSSSPALCEPQPNSLVPFNMENLNGSHNSLASAPVGFPSLQVSTTVNLYGLQITQQTTMVDFGGSQPNFLVESDTSYPLPCTRVGSHINPTLASSGCVADNFSSSGNYYPLSQYNSLPFVATQFVRQIGGIGPKIYALEETVDTTKNAQQEFGFDCSGSAPRGGSHRQIVSLSLAHTERPDIFSGADFKTWQQKMLFCLTMLNMARLLKEDPPVLGEDEVNATTQLAVDTWSHMDFMCRNIIMNGLSDAMCCVYGTSETAKELWNSLEQKYKTQCDRSKKFLVAKFLQFSMVDSEAVVSQVQHLQLIIQEILAENMVIDEHFQVAAIIEKLPPSWKEFKNFLMNSRKEMTMEDLIVILRIKENNKSAANIFSSASPSETRTNVVEGKMNKSKGKKHQESSSLGPKGGIAKKSKFNGNCFNCNGKGHKYSDCSLPKRVKWYDANTVEAIAQNISYIDLCAMIKSTWLTQTQQRDGLILVSHVV